MEESKSHHFLFAAYLRLFAYPSRFMKILHRTPIDDPASYRETVSPRIFSFEISSGITVLVHVISIYIFAISTAVPNPIYYFAPIPVDCDVRKVNCLILL